MILALKLFLTPLFIASVSLAGRRWGPAVSGWLIGLPLTSGPVSLILAAQNGLDFAARTAIGNLGGQASVCLFCLAYSYAAQRLGWLPAAVLASLAFLLSVFVWNLFSLALLPSFLLLLLAIALILRLIPRYPAVVQTSRLPAWDLPARMAIAAAFVFLLTTFAARLGPQLSGLLSPFPVFAVILAAFTHQQQGGQAAARLLRGYVFGSLGYACFFLVVGTLLPAWGILWTYLLATILAVGLNAFTMLRTR